MGVKNVTVTFIGPVCKVNIDRVGVILMSVTLAVLFWTSYWPIQEYASPSTLIFPPQLILA